MNSLNKVFHSLAAAVLLLGSGAVYANTAGYVQFVNGEVQLTTAAGQTHKIQKGDAINEGDTLTSAPAASAQIKMQDGGFVAVRPDTQLKFDSFKFSGKEDGSEQSFFSLFKGGFRAVTGLIGRINKPNYHITTPTSTIGIRGTDHETFVVALGSELAKIAPSGAYNKVNLGETSMTTDKGTIFVLPNQMGFAGGLDQMPKIQPINTNIFTVAAEPTSQGKGDKKEGKEEVRESSVVDSSGTPEKKVIIGIDSGGIIIQPPPPPPPPCVLVAGVCFTVLPPSILPVVVNGYGHEVVAPDMLGGVAYILNHYDVLLPSTSYQLDGSNNLLGILNGIYVDSAHGLANANIQFSGGVAQDAWKAADSSIYLGRWQGGNINVTDLSPTATVAPFNVAMGPASVHWLINANPPAGYVQTLVGTTSYTLAGATRPTDALGNVGTLTLATLTADFTNQLVNMALGISFTNKTFSVNATGIQIIAENAWGSGTVACTGAGCAQVYSAVLWGRLAGNQAASASLAYNLLGGTDLVQGAAAFTTATPPIVLPPSAPYVQTDRAVAYATLDFGAIGNFGAGALISNNTFIAAPADMNAPAVPSSANQPFLIDRYAGNGPGSSITHTFSGTTTVGEAPTTIAATGIQFGRYDSTQGQMVVAGTTYTNLTPGTYSSGGAVKSHWISGPAIDPVYLPEVLLTTNATYSLTGGTVPTTLTGATASLTSASLSVNFTQQLVSLNLGLTIGGAAAWTASTANAPLEVMYWNNAKAGFRAQTPFPGPIPLGWGTLTVACPTCSTGTFGTVTGQLTGSGLNGAILSYLLGDGIGQTVAGVAAFTGTAQNTATSYRIAGLSGIDWTPPSTVSLVPIPGTLGGYTNAGTVLTDGAGNVTQFNASQPFTNGSGITIGIGTATAAGLGTDPVSGISWGRWVGGALSKTDLATNVTTQHPNTAGGVVGAGAALSTHWVASPALAGPVTLPISGNYNYVLAGGTTPTDSLGNVGTLNGATLSANFTTQTVAVWVNVTTAGAGNLIASGSAIPIEQKSMFNASTAGAVQGSNPGLLTVTGSVAGTPQGHIGGAFAGAGGVGAAMIYGLVAGNGVIVNGVTAFHR
ncbi:MAG: FecR family protein [Gallionella sp.]|nr:FecR family protein [Gallionella sp.]